MSITAAPSLSSVTGSSPFNLIPNAESYVNGLVDHYILRTKAIQGLGGFVFDYLGEETLTFEADITDHYVENNTAVQDHVARKPRRVTLRGFKSELAIPAPHGVSGLLSTMQSALSQVQAYLGKYTPGVVATMGKAITQAQNVVNEVTQDLSKVQNIISLFPGAPVQQTSQEKAYAQLYTCFRGDMASGIPIPFSIDTPYGPMNNMLIERVTMTQPENTQGWSDISVTLKEIRTVEIQTVPDDGSLAGRLQQQAQGQTSKGIVPASPVPTSLAVSAAKSMGWLH